MGEEGAVENVQALGNQAVDTVQALGNTIVDGGQEVVGAGLSVLGNILRELTAVVDHLGSKA